MGQAKEAARVNPLPLDQDVCRRLVACKQIPPGPQWREKKEFPLDLLGKKNYSTCLHWSPSSPITISQNYAWSRCPVCLNWAFVSERRWCIYIYGEEGGLFWRTHYKYYLFTTTWFNSKTNGIERTYILTIRPQFLNISWCALLASHSECLSLPCHDRWLNIYTFLYHLASFQ